MNGNIVCTASSDIWSPSVSKYGKGWWWLEWHLRVTQNLWNRLNQFPEGCCHLCPVFGCNLFWRHPGGGSVWDGIVGFHNPDLALFWSCHPQTLFSRVRGVCLWYQEACHSQTLLVECQILGKEFRESRLKVLSLCLASWRGNTGWERKQNKTKLFFTEMPSGILKWLPMDIFKELERVSYMKLH